LAVRAPQGPDGPHTIHGLTRLVDGRGTRNDAIEVPREALGLDHGLTTPGRAAHEVTAIRYLLVVHLGDGLPGQCCHMGASIPKVDLCLQVVIGPYAAT